MRIFYKPTAKKTGHACNFTLTSKGSAAGVYLEIIKQTGWDDKTKTGSFKGGEKVKVKFNEGEVASFIDAINRGVEFKTFHSTADAKTQISFSPYIQEGEQKGFGLSVRQGGKSFMVGFYFNEMVLLHNFFQNCLDKFFEVAYSEHKKRIQESINK